jgi:hypothetical protein
MQNKKFETGPPKSVLKRQQKIQTVKSMGTSLETTWCWKSAWKHFGEQWQSNQKLILQKCYKGRKGNVIPVLNQVSCHEDVSCA